MFIPSKDKEMAEESSFCNTPSQVIEGKYLNPKALIELLRRVYGISDGRNNFRVELRLNQYKIYLLEHLSSKPTLTAAEINYCRVYVCCQCGPSSTYRRTGLRELKTTYE